MVLLSTFLCSVRLGQFLLHHTFSYSSITIFDLSHVFLIWSNSCLFLWTYFTSNFVPSGPILYRTYFTIVHSIFNTVICIICPSLYHLIINTKYFYIVFFFVPIKQCWGTSTYFVLQKYQNVIINFMSDWNCNFVAKVWRSQKDNQKP